VSAKIRSVAVAVFTFGKLQSVSTHFKTTEMRDKIWYEMMHTKFGDNYLALYLNRQRTIRKWYIVFMLVFSTSGIFGWTIWTAIPVIACGLIAIMQLARLIENQFILTDTDLDKVAELRNQYISYFNKLEKLWTDFYADRLTEQQVTEQFYQLRQIGADIEATDNKLHINKIKTLCDTADTETRNYFNQYHS